MNRAQSEVLGYVFVFALIVGSVALVYAVGYPSLQDAREASATENVERAFDVLDTNLNDIQHRGAPSRATEVRIAGGTLSYGESTGVTVSVENTVDSSENTSLSIFTRPLVYEDPSGRVVTFEHGAIVRGTGENSVFVDDVEWTVTSDRTVISLASITMGRTSQSVGGESTVLVMFEKKGTSVPVHFESDSSSSATVNITITSDRAGAWQSYFEAKNESYSRGIDVDDDASDGTVYWEFETESVYISQTGVSSRIAS